MDGVPPAGKRDERLRRMRQRVDACVHAARLGFTPLSTEQIIAPWAVQV
jgi:hypothetical protein